MKTLNKLLKKEQPSSVCLVTSPALAKKLSWAIKEIKVTATSRPIKIVLLPDGEKAKEWHELEGLLKKFTALNLDRDSIVIAFGGGTIGDIVGFAAGIYLRGIKYVQVPTTLVAQVDSAHGGKTGVNFLNYKNQIGCLHLPIATSIDHRFLKSLNKEHLIDGLGEIINAGYIKHPLFLKLLREKSLNLPKIVDKAIKVKQYYVSRDFKDGADRQTLNVGHTFGHAVELRHKISHGKAVIVGMLQEFAYTESLGLTLPSVRENLISLLEKLDINIDAGLKADWQAVLHDKKVAGAKIAFPVVEKIGKAKLYMFDLQAIKKWLVDF